MDLNCSTRHSREHNVLWIKVTKDQLNASIELSGSILIVKDPNISLITEIKLDSSRYKIHIHSIQEEDASIIYRCDLNAKISTNSTKSLVVEKAQSVELGCFAGGFPYPEVFWRTRNSPFLSIGNILEFPAINKRDRGDYYCIAENGVRNDTSRRISIEVEFPPIVTTPLSRVGQAVNHDAYLVCRVEANPQPAISWIYRGREISNNQHYWISNFASPRDKMDSSLLINIKNYLYGDYICKASNILGAAEIIITAYSKYCFHKHMPKTLCISI
ncbi:lachesin-like [Aphis craccivora]|uniref:Lachesin-like n=1 Tax=Aphis craccivora TaxID=307492 RepID=A0A6G0W2M0_APHCR|nr:lachesin-like [Aphis craccivora]